MRFPIPVRPVRYAGRSMNPPTRNTTTNRMMVRNSHREAGASSGWASSAERFNAAQPNESIWTSLIGPRRNGIASSRGTENRVGRGSTVTVPCGVRTATTTR